MLINNNHQSDYYNHRNNKNVIKLQQKAFAYTSPTNSTATVDIS